MSETVILCSRKATAYKYFAIQYYGECWGGNDETYFLSGSSQQCWMGTGKEFNNYVYSYNGPESKYLSHGRSNLGARAPSHFSETCTKCPFSCSLVTLLENFEDAKSD